MKEVHNQKAIAEHASFNFKPTNDYHYINLKLVLKNINPTPAMILIHKKDILLQQIVPKRQKPQQENYIKTYQPLYSTTQNEQTNIYAHVINIPQKFHTRTTKTTTHDMQKQGQEIPKKFTETQSEE